MEQHLIEALRSGPVTKFSGLNVVRMLGENYRLFFGESPSRIGITFLLINVPATIANVTIAGVSMLHFLTLPLGLRCLER